MIGKGHVYVVYMKKNGFHVHVHDIHWGFIDKGDSTFRFIFYS